MSDARAGFINYPESRPHNIAYEAPPKSANPVIKGSPLTFLSAVVTNVPLLPTILWRNAGFNTLRTREELDNVEPRYDPTVVRLPSPGEEALPSALRYESLRVPPGDAPGRFYTIADYHEAYKSGRLTPSDVVEALLPLIRRDAANRSPHSTAFIDTRVDLVTQAAEASTRRWKEGKPLGVLDGVPFGAKDDLDVKGYKRYNGTTKDYTEGEEVETSWCVTKVEEAGGIMVGKMSMHELGMDTTNNNPNWGTPLNPYNSSYYTGGSTGGGAYAVAAGLVPFAIGSDGGGSVRIPSGYCGLYGLKTSHGRVSTLPLSNFDNSVTVRGPVASTMVDLEISYLALASPNPSDRLSAKFAQPRLSAGLSPSSSKPLGICKPWFDRADPVVQQACHAALQYLVSEHGYSLIDIAMPLTYEGQIAHAMTILAEVTTKVKSLAGLTPANKILLSVSRATLATDFLLAQKVRQIHMQHLAHLFTTHPGLIIVTPTTPNAGWPIGDGELSHGMTDGNTQVRNMEYVWLANFTGVPCLQFPVGYVKPVKGEGRVPVGMMGHGEWGSEEELIEWGYKGEEWLNKGYEGGRRRPAGWVDVLRG
ncbi:glutamyl-tRNA amidotransferas-like protein subunit A [Bimuria novae-zelandiae CBS 107.79]|uniref:Glutamyl-tRNA amidotransferas-like protein subunit A n=1 Tax=Bimuria novae-zelandiae CBS 107.79 TaxID=1447943 RepID=A0A6A5V3S6_9PLEO|nr:glutamyl-tRNA amidotransferas-like protein subunit A [Bimuria novae-zelandiae CBS 107.79]